MVHATGQWAEQFEAGMTLAGQGNLDGALALLVDCVIAEPGSAVYASGFLGTLEQRFPAAQPQAYGEPAERIGKALEAGNRTDILRHGPGELLRNPWHVPLLRALAMATGAAGSHEAEAGYLRRVVEAAPNDLELQRSGGRDLSRLQRYPEALACWERVEYADPGDTEAAREIARMIVKLNRQRSGMPSAVEGGAPALSAPAVTKTSRLERLMKMYIGSIGSGEVPLDEAKVKLMPAQQLEAVVREYPGNGACYVQLASLYLEKGRDYDAEKLLSRGRAATGEDPRVRELWEETCLLRWENKFLAAQKQATLDGSPATQAALAEVAGARERVTTEICLARCQRAPHNAEHRFEFGVRLKKAGRPREACQQFDIALRDDGYKAQAALEIAECCQLLGDAPAALGYYRRASEAALAPAQWPIRKQALERAGELALSLKLYRLARRYLAEIVHSDPRDAHAAERLHAVERQLM